MTERQLSLRLLLPSLALCMLQPVILALLLTRTDLVLVPGDSTIAYTLIAVFAGVALAWFALVGRAAIVLMFGSIAMFCWAALFADAIGRAGLAMGFPLVDPYLAAFNEGIRFDSSAYVRLLDKVPGLLWFLAKAYGQVATLVLVTLIFLGLTGRWGRLGETMLIYMLTLTIVVTLSGFLPAEGLFRHSSIEADVGHLLHPEAGKYYFAAFDRFHSGAATTLDLGSPATVVTFPSFHTVMALLFPYALRGIRLVFWPMAVLNLCILLSVIPMGGHYVADMIAGALVFVAACALAPRLLPQGERTKAVPEVLPRPVEA